MSDIKIMKNAAIFIETIYGDKRPMGEKLYSKYVYGIELTVVIWEKWYFDKRGNGVISARAFGSDNVELFCSDSLDDFFGELEARGYQIGYHENERIVLTERGETEVCLMAIGNALV